MLKCLKCDMCEHTCSRAWACTIRFNHDVHRIHQSVLRNVCTIHVDVMDTSFSYTYMICTYINISRHVFSRLQIQNSKSKSKSDQFSILYIYALHTRAINKSE